MRSPNQTITALTLTAACLATTGTAHAESPTRTLKAASNSWEYTLWTCTTTPINADGSTSTAVTGRSCVQLARRANGDRAVRGSIHYTLTRAATLNRTINIGKPGSLVGPRGSSVAGTFRPDQCAYAVGPTLPTNAPARWTLTPGNRSGYTGAWHSDTTTCGLPLDYGTNMINAWVSRYMKPAEAALAYYEANQS